jgi:hypothetical protein
MPITVEEFIDEPIVAFEFENPLDTETAFEANHEALSTLDRIGSYYAVLDFRDLTMPIKDALGILKAQRDGQPDMISHPQIHYVVVTRRANHSGDALVSVTGNPPPLVFQRRDDAIDHLRIIMATRAYRLDNSKRNSKNAQV